MLECVVNISEGRDPDVLRALRAAAGSHLLDLHADPHHHRSVLTLVGEDAPRAVSEVAVARRICASCPVQAPCLEYALTHHIDHGVWGGASERERRRILKRRRAAASTAS